MKEEGEERGNGKGVASDGREQQDSGVGRQKEEIHPWALEGVGDSLKMRRCWWDGFP